MPVHFRRTFLLPLIVLMAWLGAARGLAGEPILNAQEQAIFNHLASDADQQRAFLHLDPTLCQVARARAADMGRRGYYDHTDPDGHGPNWWVERAGYTLPAGYDHSDAGNNIESIAAAYTDPSDTWNAWMDSSLHRQHLLATHPFFVDQTSVGIGVVYVAGSEWKTYWVVLTAPPNGPVLSITAPSANQKLFAAQVTVNGATSGAPAAASVQACVENGAWITAAGTANWSVTLSGLQPGENVLHVRSLNAAGAVLDEAARTVRYAVLTPLAVQITGSGTVTDGFAGTTQRELGRAYTIAATPASGWLFDSWSGGVASADATLSFTMRDGLALTANFIPNPFIATAGHYAGLFASGDLHGVFKLRFDATGAFTARVRYNGLVLPLVGKFDPHGDATVSTLLSGGTTLTTMLHLELSGGTPQVRASLTDGIFTAELNLDALPTPDGGSSVYAGRYTIVIPAVDDATQVTPGGDGIATLVVNATGAVTLAGALADGTKFLVGGTVSASGQLALYVPLYDGAGVLTGALHFRATSASDLDGALFWSKPAAFALTTNAVGARYTAPAPGQSVLIVPPSADNTALALGDGDLNAPVTQLATLGMDNRVALDTPVVPGLTLTIKPGSGRFVGQFVHPMSGAVTKFRGVVLQKQNAGFGFFLGATTSGYTTFAPATASPVLRMPGE